MGPRLVLRKLTSTASLQLNKYLKRIKSAIEELINVGTFVKIHDIIIIMKYSLILRNLLHRIQINIAKVDIYSIFATKWFFGKDKTYSGKIPWFQGICYMGPRLILQKLTSTGSLQLNDFLKRTKSTVEEVLN